MGVIAFVPARGGSKSVPLKNIKNFCGKPLIYWNLKALSDVPDIDTIFVATDSDKIADCVQGMGFSKVRIYHRTAENAQDTSSTEAVMLEFIEAEALPDDTLFVLAQLTSPFTTSLDVEKAIQQLKAEKADSLLSCCRFKRFFWAPNGSSQNYDFRKRPRRQDFEGSLLENGAFYINSVSNIKKNKNRLSGKISIYEMPEYSQFEIDEPHDWLIAEELFKVTSYKVFEQPLLGRVRKIKIVLSDVDGVLTDGGMYYTENGDELKKFNTRDGKGFELLRNRGLKTGIITSEETKLMVRRANKLKLDYAYQAVTNQGKLAAVKEICKKEGLKLEEVAYIGDDVNCYELLSAVGLAACPNDAVMMIKSIPSIVILQQRGGEGALREFADLIISYK